jgi:hypothetical protein
MTMNEARPMTAEESGAYREVEQAHEAEQAARRRGRVVQKLSWSNDNSRMAKITDPDGDEWLRLQFVETHTDSNGHAVFRQVECLIPCKFRTIA